MSSWAVRGAARRAGCSDRSVRRWLAEGRAEVAAFSPQARLALRLRRAEEHVQALSWEATAAKLEALAAEPFDLGLD